ncbi:caspase family protein [Calothrix sp. PCC 6303]|uniref:caspase family protein n=1 Tax=Calothrix sp. PCC 6303 TaxID=1170562 RepID=UPI0002A03AAB|nr:caspase family protein [Calothrix sp. PCC 6303]AFZ03226.1 peptidase C14 caspase catalytic subunit p20 [Calothrix sp. PCC 6303]
MKRRTFIRRVGSILTVLGVAEANWLTPKSPYYQALAQSNPRKLALLVGINQYPGNSSLSGCLTDVELQRQLLINRFGFESRNILTLTDDQASRQSLEDAFLEHFVKQVKVGDTVFFHFSGYGSRVKSENVIVPVDGNLGNYILEDTLLLMLRSLPTNNVVATLDTSYNLPEQELPVSTVTRSLAAATNPINNIPAEIEFQNQFIANPRNQQSILVIKAGKHQQPSTELQMSGLSAGLFTYALTQHLWESTPATTIQTSLRRVENSLQLLGSQQQPTLWTQNQQRPLITDYLPSITVSAEGSIIASEEDGKTWQLWLGGIPAHILEYYGINSQFQVVSKDGNYVTDLIMRSRNGLIAKAQINPTDTTLPQIGQLLRESIRVLPRNISLTIALDRSLDRVERVDATSSFANISRVSNVKTGEQPGDYILGKLSPVKPEASPSSNLISISTPYGLYSLGGELIPNTDGEAGEAVKIAVQRLVPKLQTLLAAKLWQLTDNQISSGLPIKVSLEMLNGVSPKVLMQRETQRIQSSETEKPCFTIPIGSRIQYRIENKCDRTLYLMLLGLDSLKNPFILYPGQQTTDTTPATLRNLTIEPGSSITVPQTAPGFDWVMQGLTNLWQTQLIFSTAPFTQSITTLATTKLPPTQQQRIIPLSNPCEVSQAILQDLHNANVQNKETGDNYILNVNNWASLGFIFQVL